MFHVTSTLSDFHDTFNKTLSSQPLPEDIRTRLTEDVEKISTLIFTPMKKLSVVKKESSETDSNPTEAEIFSNNNSENVQLKVKMELEHERRLRTQEALDDAERRYFALRRECDNKESEYNRSQNENKRITYRKEMTLR